MYTSVLPKPYNLYSICCEHTRRPTFTYGNPLRINKSYNGESAGEILYVKVKTLKNQVSFI